MANTFILTLSSPSTDEEFTNLLRSPKRTRTEEGTVEERSVDELIKADRYLNPPIEAPPWGIRMARHQPGSTTPGA